MFAHIFFYFCLLASVSLYVSLGEALNPVKMDGKCVEVEDCSFAVKRLNMPIYVNEEHLKNDRR